MYRRITLFLSLLILLSFGNLAFASNGRRRASGNTERLEGVLTAVAANQVTVRTAKSDRIVNLTASTVVKINGVKSTASALNTGDKVEVQAMKASDGTLTAAAVEVDNDSEVSGVVSDVSSTSLTITTKNGDATFTVDDNTVVILHGVKTTVSVLQKGDNVEVHWVAGPNDTRIARLINAHSDVVNVEGKVTAFSGDSITVQPNSGGDPVTLAITPDTVIQADAHQTSVTTIAVGTRVEIKAIKNADGTLTAIWIHVNNPNDLEEIHGTVTQVGTDSITVDTGSGDPVTIAVTPDTIIRIDDQMASLSDIKTGDKVEVNATSDGTTLTAVRIQVETEDDDQFTEVKGAVASVNGSVVTVMTKKGPVDVTVTSSTTFRGGSVSDLQMGTLVEISAKKNSDGSLEALNVEIQTSNGGSNNNNGTSQTVEFKGSIADVSKDSITVRMWNGKTTVAFDGSTVVQKGNKIASTSDLKTGQTVEIKAQRRSDNTLLAKSIKIDD